MTKKRVVSLTEGLCRISLKQMYRWDPERAQNLHEAAKTEDCKVEAAALEKLLCAVLDGHEGDLRMAVTVVDGKEDVPRDPHSLQPSATTINELV